MAKALDNEEDLTDSYEKFIKHQGLVQWPVTCEENLTELPSDFVGCKLPEEILDYLRMKVAFPLDSILSIYTSLDELSIKLKKHASTLSQAQTKKTKKEIDTRKFDDLVEKAHRKIKEEGEKVHKPQRLCIEDYDYPGFTEVENTDIPWHPNPFQHLQSVSEAQHFKAGFLKIWKPFFISSLSVAMLKDTFWWFFLHKFKSNMVEEENKLFDHISGVFVSLLMTVQMDLKDKLLEMYPDCLAQAVYTAFYGAFPESKERLDDDFKRYLAELITFWISGMKPKLFSWQRWNLSCLVPAAAGDEDNEEDSIHAQKMESEELTTQTRRLTLTVPDISTKKELIDTGADRERERESHYCGPSPQFQHVQFKPCAQSPLVLRYLQIHKIPIPAGSYKIKCTEIMPLPDPTPKPFDAQ